MKIISKLMLISFFSFFVMAGYAQDEIIVSSDHNPAITDFGDYSTFTFADHINEADDNDAYLSEYGSMKSTLKTAVRAQLQAMGYEYAEGPEADLLVNFQVLDEDIEFRGWDNTEQAGFPGSTAGAIGATDNRVTHELQEGTLMIHLADVEQGIEIWRGYASGIIDGTELTDDNEVKIHEAVSRIFSEFNFTASR